jgi:hypothetical protein
MTDDLKTVKVSIYRGPMPNPDEPSDPKNLVNEVEIPKSVLEAFLANHADQGSMNWQPQLIEEKSHDSP